MNTDLSKSPLCGPFGHVDKINVENKIVVFEFNRVGWNQGGLESVTNLITAISDYFSSSHFPFRPPKLLDGYGIQFLQVPLNLFILAVSELSLNSACSHWL
jgi:hypothetical protein